MPSEVPGPVAQHARRILEDLRGRLPSLFAGGLVDLESGELLDIETAGAHPTDFLSYLAHTTKAYFVGDPVRTIQSVLDDNSPSEPPSREIDEITIRSHGFLHVMTRLPSHPRYVLVAVTTPETKFGFALGAVRVVAAEARMPEPSGPPPTTDGEGRSPNPN